jgi:hypothetical protein
VRTKRAAAARPPLSFFYFDHFLRGNKDEFQFALTVTVSVSTGVALNRCCNSAEDANTLPRTDRAGNWKVSGSANG